MGNIGVLRQREHQIFSPEAGKKTHGFRENDKNLKLANGNKGKVAERRNSLLGNEM